MGFPNPEKVLPTVKMPLLRSILTFIWFTIKLQNVHVVLLGFNLSIFGLLVQVVWAGVDVITGSCCPAGCQALDAGGCTEASGSSDLCGNGIN